MYHCLWYFMTSHCIESGKRERETHHLKVSQNVEHYSFFKKVFFKRNSISLGSKRPFATDVLHYFFTRNCNRGWQVSKYWGRGYNVKIKYFINYLGLRHGIRTLSVVLCIVKFRLSECYRFTNFTSFSN